MNTYANAHIKVSHAHKMNFSRVENKNFSPTSEGENERLARLQKEKAEADENFRNQIVIQNNIREFGEFKDDHFEVSQNTKNALLQGTSRSYGDQMVSVTTTYWLFISILGGAASIFMSSNELDSNEYIETRHQMLFSIILTILDTPPTRP